VSCIYPLLALKPQGRFARKQIAAASRDAFQLILVILSSISHVALHLQSILHCRNTTPRALSLTIACPVAAMTDRTNAGVRNLRAMFESQNASSPEPRGRSPAGTGSEDSPARPTSKVRASFVSVVPPQPAIRDLGTTKGVSVNSTQAQRRASFSVSEDLDAGAPTELKRVVSQEKEEREKNTSISEAIPEQAVETRESSRAPPPIHKAPEAMPNLGSIMKGSDFPEPAANNEHLPTEAGAQQHAPKVEEKPAAPLSTDALGDNPDKIVTGVQEDVTLKPADLTDAATVSGGKALPPPAENLATSSTTQSTAGISKAAASTPKANGTSAAPTKAAIKKPAAISTAKPSASKASSARSPLPKSPGAARLPRTPTTPKPAPAPAASAAASKSPAPVKAQPKPAVKAPAPKASRTSLRPSATTTAPTASAAAKAKAPVAEVKKPAAPKPATAAPAAKDTTTTSPGGFKKPKPKSPTRPVRLPSHLTAPTASFAAKHGEEAAAQKVVRKPSTTTRPAPKAAPAAKKQPSRASLAPSTAPVKRPESRTSTQGGAGEGFLARMMRPTASSASKTLDKPQSPPRKTAASKAPVKPKGHEGVVAKGKKKVEEVAEKVKDAVTNGHSEEKTNGNAEDKADTNGHDGEKAGPAETSDVQPAQSEPVADGGAVKEPERVATPTQTTDSSTVEIQTPNFEGQTIR
jgi:hypothetical protein